MKKVIISVITVLSVLSVFTGCSAREMDNAGSRVESSFDSVEDKVESGINGITGNDSSNNNNNNNNNNSNTSSTAKITADEAKKIALKHANLSEADVSDVDIELERDNGVLNYEITFDTKTTEYDYHIDANTGDIISSSKEKRD